MFKLFKQNGKDIIISLDNIVSVKSDEASKKTVIHSTTQSNEVDESFDEVKQIIGLGTKREVRGF